MMKSRWVDLRGNRAAVVLRGAIILILLSAASSYAQAGGDDAPQRPQKLFDVERWDFEPTRPVRPLFPQYGANFDRQPAPAPQSPGRGRSAGRKILGAAVGATVGFFAGGYLGAAIEGDGCHCDDPGLKGAIIGAPIGAAAGGILGYKFLF